MISITSTNNNSLEIEDKINHSAFTKLRDKHGQLICEIFYKVQDGVMYLINNNLFSSENIFQKMCPQEDTSFENIFPKMCPQEDTSEV